jgi:hypothetical protein
MIIIENVAPTAPVELEAKAYSSLGKALGNWWHLGAGSNTPMIRDCHICDVWWFECDNVNSAVQSEAIIYYAVIPRSSPSLAINLGNSVVIRIVEIRQFVAAAL